MPAVRRTRTVAATPQELWTVVGDPHHLPRWWPRVERVEGVDDDAFTEVLRSSRGSVVRADFRLLSREDGHRVVWAQEIDGTPFARVLSSAQTEIELTPDPNELQRATEVAIELRQSLRGVLVRLGTVLVRRAASSTLEEALDNLERIVGGVDAPD